MNDEKIVISVYPIAAPHIGARLYDNNSPGILSGRRATFWPIDSEIAERTNENQCEKEVDDNRMGMHRMKMIEENVQIEWKKHWRNNFNWQSGMENKLKFSTRKKPI